MPTEISPSRAGSILTNANRVLVIGNSGAGKSTLSRMIEDRFGLPHVSINREIRWLPGWNVRDREEQRRLTIHYASQPRWVMDGTTVSTFDIRVPRADLVIWIRPTRRRALWQLGKRVWRYHGKVRSDMAEGCPEQLPDWEFLEWIWTFERRQAPKIIKALEEFGPNVPLAVVRTVADSKKVFA